MTYPAIYQARSTGSSTKGLDVFVPQVFGDVPVKITRFIGSSPDSLGMGWVLFQGGDPAYPVWIGLDFSGDRSPITTGIPSGGLSGQVLAKQSNSNYDASWGDLPDIDTGVLLVAGGANITVDNSNPKFPVVAVTGIVPSTGGFVSSLTVGQASGTNIVLNGSDTTEGAQILWNGGSSYGSVTQDMYADAMRFYRTSDGASLLTIDRIGGNVSVAGQLSANSLSSAGNINGYSVGAAAGGNRIVVTTPEGYINGNYINMTADVVGGWPTYVAGQNGDNYMRWYNKSGAFSAGGDVIAGSYLYATGNTMILGAFPGGVGWTNTDNVWVRSYAGKGIWTDGVLGCSGGLSVGMGGAISGGYIADINGYMRVTQRIDSGGFNTGSASTFADISTGYVTTRNGYRVTSNGTWNGAWQNSSLISQGNIGSEARANISWNTIGYYAACMGITTYGGIAAYNSDSGGYETLTGYINNVSSRDFKQDIKPWRPRSLGSAVLSPADRLSLIDVVQFRPRREHILSPVGSAEDGTAGSEVHDCDTHLCDGTSAHPCKRVQDWENPHIGIVIEDLATVLPEAVGLSPHGEFGSMRLDTMVGFLLAVCKEQQERIEALEQQHQEAA